MKGGKNSSFANIGSALACAICKCAVCGWGLFVFEQGRKKQNKFPLS
ncbi:MAG: hypothetical protein ACI8XB_002464 [Patiriisocius sp.]|jgi:hypothetical protein